MFRKTARTTLKNQRGNALIVVLGIVALLSAMVSLTASSVGNNLLLAKHVQKRKSTFYIIESTRSIITSHAQAYLSSTSTPTNGGLETAVGAGLSAALPDGYAFDQLEVEIRQMPIVLPIANGPFAGMLAPQTIARFKYRVKSTDIGESQTFNSIDTTIALAQIGMFQFTYFVDLPYADWYPGPTMEVRGRTHINGDFCIAGQSKLTFEKITASGRIMHGSDSRCYAPKKNAVFDKTFISTGSDLTTSKKLHDSADHGCVNCLGTGQNWRTYALSTWNGNLLDSAHGVSRLALPRPRSVYAQYGFNNYYYRGWLNSNNLRFIVDPVLPIDPPETAQAKFSYKADIRIIDGVWYLKNPDNETDWPGLPIWSDHPGHFVDSWGKAVGQDDLRAFWNARGRPWPNNDKPHKFSYYEYDSTNQNLYNDDKGVVSYGNLYRDDSGPRPHWAPGHWIGSDSAATGTPPTVPPANRRKSRLCDATGSYVPLTAPLNGLRSAFEPISCSDGATRPIATGLLNSTRSGFRDGHIELTHSHPRHDMRLFNSKVLPMNFSVKDFQDALSTTAAGELGSYFGPGSYMNRGFNGVVWTTTRWPGSENGFDPVGSPSLPPPQGFDAHPTIFSAQGDDTNLDAGQIGTTTPMRNQNQALPYNLCTQTVAPSAGVAPGAPFDRAVDGTSRFTVPNCDSYMHSGSNGAFPSVVRVTNGHVLNKSLFPNGFTVVSNLPVYILGGYNVESDTTNETASNWISALVGGDLVTALSDGWDDSKSTWRESTCHERRDAKSTTYNTTILTGFARPNHSSWSVPMHTLPMLLEWWDGRMLTVNGSVVMGYYPVYSRNFAGHYASNMNCSYAAGERIVSFDPHLQHIVNQPPGTPLFYVSATVNWKIK